MTVVSLKAHRNRNLARAIADRHVTGDPALIRWPIAHPAPGELDESISALLDEANEALADAPVCMPTSPEAIDAWFEINARAVQMIRDELGPR
ncbi:hypothetical protein V5738_10920 [Salinisphaera sp. SPP-AMP-43]|uniref:hypothetical protein n=1 Tax=Salinisphaera sp. SPP-AMP-43 TaxID=3121288 RepID=UPI003C6E5BC3